MRTVFADTFYWISLANPKDQWHDTVIAASKGLGPCRIVTTDEVLSEFLTFYSQYGPVLRLTAVTMVRSILRNSTIDVVEQTRDSFGKGLALYESRLDKEYSLTDCISMECMRELMLREVLTHDHHFEQEGFTILIKDKIP